MTEEVPSEIQPRRSATPCPRAILARRGSSRVFLPLIFVCSISCDPILGIDSPTETACGEADLTSDAANCGRCENACASGVCIESRCPSIQPVGYFRSSASSGSTDFAAVGPIPVSGGEGQLAGVSLAIEQAGWVTDFGMITTFGGNVHGYLGLYADVGGLPSTRLAETALFTVNGDPQDGGHPQTTVARVDPPQWIPAGTYWMMGSWDNVVTFVAYSGQGMGPTCDGCIDWYLLNRGFGPPPATLPMIDDSNRLPIPILYIHLAMITQ
jgi:hypothetical protein